MTYEHGSSTGWLFPFDEHWKDWLFALLKTAIPLELKLIFVKIWALKYLPSPSAECSSYSICHANLNGDCFKAFIFLCCHAQGHVQYHFFSYRCLLVFASFLERLILYPLICINGVLIVWLGLFLVLYSVSVFCLLSLWINYRFYNIFISVRVSATTLFSFKKI